MPHTKNILFYGELPPESIHGIAISNKINIDILKTVFDVFIVQEKSNLGAFNISGFKKLKWRISELFSIIKNASKSKFEYFYLVFSVSLSGGVKTLLAILFFKLFNRGKTVLHIHRGDFIERYDQSIIFRFIARLILNLSSKIIVLSDSQAKHLLNKPVYVLHNTIEHESPSGEKAFNEKERKRFLFISNYLAEKGIIDLLEVFKKLIDSNSNIQLNTYGTFSSVEIKEKLFKFSDSRIIIGEKITGDMKFSELKKADCLVLPSYNEGEPMIILEAMSVGTPIIATNVGLIPEMLGENYPFIPAPGDRKSLEEKILNFLNYQNVHEISNMLSERYSHFYSNRSHSIKLLEIFC